ncbi:MAG: hypothetical protein IIA67_07250 [Planctomycetes bacterium]|nr:hypothetical protein [Planctomycetota bacterium]
MKNKSPIFTVLILGGLAALLWRAAATGLFVGMPAEVAEAQPADRPHVNPTPAGAAETDPEADRLVQDAVRAMDSYTSVEAKIRHKAELFDSRLIGSGMYWQAGHGGDKRLRLELKIPVAGKVSTLQQVCNDDYLWIHETFGEDSQLTQIDIRRVRRAISQSPARLRGESSLRWLALGGLPMLLASLQESFYFTIVEQQGTLNTADVTGGGRPTWTLLGRWKREKLAHLLGEEHADGAKLDVSRLAAHVPDHVVLRLSKDDLFPYAIEFRKRDGNASDEASALAGAKSLVIMEWFDVRLNDPIDPARFLYDPGNLKRINGTDRFLKRLGLTE